MTWLATRLAALRAFSIRRLVSSLLQAFGVLWLIVEAGSYFSQSFSEAARSAWWFILLLGLVVGVHRAWPRVSVQARIAGTDSSVEVRVCDIFDLRQAMVIGSNTTFDTSVEDGVISKDSLQGQYTERFCPSVQHLDIQLGAALEDEPPSETLSAEGKPYGKRMRYEVGTVATVDFDGRKAYFLAISTLNQFKTASSDREDLLRALPRLWEFIRERGDMESLCIPVLGTGFGRVRGTREDLTQEIIKSFVAAATAGSLCERLTIAISPSDFRRGLIDLTSIGSFLEHVCLYAGGEPSPNAPRGIPATPAETPSLTTDNSSRFEHSAPSPSAREDTPSQARASIYPEEDPVSIEWYNDDGDELLIRFENHTDAPIKLGGADVVALRWWSDERQRFQSDNKSALAYIAGEGYEVDIKGHEDRSHVLVRHLGPDFLLNSNSPSVTPEPRRVSGLWRIEAQIKVEGAVTTNHRCFSWDPARDPPLRTEPER